MEDYYTESKSELTVVENIDMAGSGLLFALFTVSTQVKCSPIKCHVQGLCSDAR